MELQLFSIDQAPRSLPMWDVIREDLASPPAHRIARVLGVGLSTVYRWNAAGRAPRVACLALFWLTRWGRSEIDTRATNDAILAVSLARSLTEDRQRLREQLADLELEHRRVMHAMARIDQLRPRPDAGLPTLAWPDLGAATPGADHLLELRQGQGAAPPTLPQEAPLRSACLGQACQGDAHRQRTAAYRRRGQAGQATSSDAARPETAGSDGADAPYPGA